MEVFNNIEKWIKMKLSLNETFKDSNSSEYKILVLGEKGVGKSSIINRFTLNEFSLEIKPTHQTECYTKELKIADEKINLYILDTDENILKSDRSLLYADVAGAFVVYDITKSKTFDKVDSWVLDVKQYTNKNIPVIILANKADLNFLRNVDTEEGLEKAEYLDCDFYETSCCSDNSVLEAFKLMVAKIYYSRLPEAKKNYFQRIYNTEEANNDKDNSDKVESVIIEEKN